MGKVRLAARVPDDQYHGLMAMSKKLLERPHDVVLAVVKLDVAEVRTLIRDENDDRYEDDEQIPVVKLLAIEPILHDPEKGVINDLYREAYFARTGEGETLEEGGVIQFARSRDAQETGESGWPTPPAPSSEVAKEEPGNETPGQDGPAVDVDASSSGSTDEVTGDGTGQALPPAPEAAYAEDPVVLLADAGGTGIAPAGSHLRAVPTPAFVGPAGEQ